PSPYPDAWNLREIFSYAIIYGLYLTASTVAFFAVIFKTNFFESHFSLPHPLLDDSGNKIPNDPVYHSVIYLQVSTISQALIFITRSRGFFFTERPSIMLMIAFIVAQLVATFIAVYANWGFTELQGCGWNWAGIVWIWNIIWFLPMDLIKFGMRALFEPKNDLKNTKTPMAGQSRRASALSGTSSARYYANRTRSLKSLERPQNFGKKLLGMNKKMSMDAKEMRRFSSVQTNHAAQVLNNNASS
ncbi:plasma membrane H+-ATPase, partial [Rhizopus azygosporus]